MQLPYKQLPSHLAQNELLPIYLISGDVPLLVQEARDAIRHTAKELGYHQRQLFFVETGFNWYEFQQFIDNFNLFSEKCFVEIRNPKAKFDAHGIKVIINYLKEPIIDKKLVITTDKLSAAQQKTSWYKAIEQHGVVIRIWPIARHELPRWIGERLQRLRLTANPRSINLLAELTEGNLLATQQAIEKLHLLYPNQPITEKMITTVISDHARFTIFDLANEALSGSPPRVHRILGALQATGTDSTLVLWALVRELRQLYTLAQEHQQGKSLSSLLASQWQTRRAMLQRALTRLNTEKLATLLQWAANIDQTIKGIRIGRPWQELESFSLVIAGADPLPK